MKKVIWQKAAFIGCIAGALYFLTASVMDYLNHGLIAWIENIVSSAVFTVLVTIVWRNKPRFKEGMRRKGIKW